MPDRDPTSMPNALPEKHKPYSTPRLLEYGEVRELTAGGTGSAVETSSAGKVRSG
jgi:hypothetical protein